MDDLILKELLERLEDNSKKKNKDNIITDEKIQEVLETLLKQEAEKTYNRILSEEERRILTPEAFSYLLQLLNMKSIDKNLFETVITLSMQLNFFLKKQINKNMIDDVVNFLIFSGERDASIKDLLDLFFLTENDFEQFETIN
ncbi:MAG: hypothetical protein DRZ79_05280 [Candidatus Cloacimonadota bacterium]|nr:MAG: hypothetical protein DRZ79_05280 [Candidatus Cloacimonadota bacterium]